MLDGGLAQEAVGEAGAPPQALARAAGPARCRAVPRFHSSPIGRSTRGYGAACR
jgi:hypothetical protein